MSHKYQPIICYYNHFAVAVNFLLAVQIKDVKSNKYQVKVKVNIHSKAKANIHSKVKVSRDRMFKGSNNKVNTHKMHSNNSTTSRVSTNRMGNSSNNNNSNKRGQHPSKVSITSPALHPHQTGIRTVKATTTLLPGYTVRLTTLLQVTKATFTLLSPREPLKQHLQLKGTSNKMKGTSNKMEVIKKMVGTSNKMEVTKKGMGTSNKKPCALGHTLGPTSNTLVPARIRTKPMLHRVSLM